jgi:hypothetical protein
LQLANETGELRPEVALVGSTATGASEAMGLAGKSSAENIDGFEFGTTDCSDILVAPHVRPVLREHRPTKRVNLHLPRHLKARPREPQIEAADAGEQAPHRHRSPASARATSWSSEERLIPIPTRIRSQGHMWHEPIG